MVGMLTPTAAGSTGNVLEAKDIIICVQRNRCGILATIGVTGITLLNVETDLNVMNVMRDVLN